MTFVNGRNGSPVKFFKCNFNYCTFLKFLILLPPALCEQTFLSKVTIKNLKSSSLKCLVQELHTGISSIKPDIKVVYTSKVASRFSFVYLKNIWKFMHTPYLTCSSILYQYLFFLLYHIKKIYQSFPNKLHIYALAWV